MVQGDVAGLPFADGAFDLVLSAFTHSDVDDFEAVAREGRRLLRPLAAPMAPGWSIPDTDKWAGAPAVRGPWSGGSLRRAGTVSCPNGSRWWHGV